MSRFESSYGGDTYRELASIRANTQASVAFQALQTGLLAQMNGSMNSIHAEMANARQQQSEALAIQQELLNREQIQSHLEEFVFQAEKLVAECSKTTTDIPASSRYFLLMGVLGKIKENGIGTPVIKGRDNKAAFDKVVNDTKGLTQRLLTDPEVQEALEWAEAESLRKAEEQKRLKAERIKAKQERQANIKKLEQKLCSLQGQLKTVFPKEVAMDWWEKAKPKLPTWGKNKLMFLLAIYPGSLFMLFALPFIMIAMVFETNKRTKELNRETNDQIATIMQQLSDLRAGVEE